MAGDKFIYVTFIRTSPDKLWEALTKPEFTRAYWFGMHQESDWRKGSEWKLVFEDGRVADAGEIVECEPPRRLVISWRNEFIPEFRSEGFSRCVLELEPAGEAVKLTVTHSIDRENSRLIGGVSNGWPQILSRLKTLLETGSVLDIPHTRPPR